MREYMRLRPTGKIASYYEQDSFGVVKKLIADRLKELEPDQDISKELILLVKENTEWLKEVDPSYGKEAPRLL